LENIYLRPRLWLEVLISCVLSVAVFTMLMHYWVVARLYCSFLPLDKEYSLVIKHSKGTVLNLLHPLHTRRRLAKRVVGGMMLLVTSLELLELGS
jgi:hypothetical protein